MEDASEPAIGQLVQRVNKLQRAIVALSCVAFLALFLLAALSYFLISDHPASDHPAFAKLYDKTQSISARSIAIYNDDGNMVASLGAFDLTAHLSLSDARGEPVALLSVGNDRRPSLILIDPEKKTRAVLDFKSNGSPSLTFADPPNASRLRLTTDGNPAMTLADPKGVARWSASADQSGGHVRMFDASGTEVQP
jgi:hypothetical protein